MQECLTDVLQSEELSGETSYFCNACAAYRSAYIEHSFSKLRQYLIVHLKGLTQQDNVFRKNIQKVFCTPNITVPVVDSDVSIRIKYQLL